MSARIQRWFDVGSEKALTKVDIDLAEARITAHGDRRSAAVRREISRMRRAVRQHNARVAAGERLTASERITEFLDLRSLGRALNVPY